VLDWLHQYEVADNTIVIFFSDNSGTAAQTTRRCEAQG